MSKTTEQRNPNSLAIDTLSTFEILQTINQEDRKVAGHVAEELTTITKIVDRVVFSLQQGGRLFYVGSGTSGRLGVLDASECPPTFSTHPKMVQGIIAGGAQALTSAIEGAEDSLAAGRKSVHEVQINAVDTLIGISASGSTPFVLAAVEEAALLGANVFGITCNKESLLSTIAEETIEVIVGPEVLSGSTRLKAGTAQKMVLNMITTASMIKLGKTYGNLMVDLKASNKKLQSRALNMVQEVASCSQELATQALMASKWQVKNAILMVISELTADEAQQILLEEHGFLRAALKREGIR